METDGSFGLSKSNRPNTILLVIIILGVIFCIVGGILIGGRTSYEGYEIVTDYTECKKGNSDKMCKDFLKETWIECSCYIKIEINETMKAPVTVLYELESYDQVFSYYFQSRDDNQLAGHLSPKPSDSCGLFNSTNTPEGIKPIAPCGELADAMFNDTFKLQTNNEYVSYYRDGLITEDEKKNFKNPPGQNLSEAFKNFSKPINWQKNVWELDTETPENNGFRNEAFIIWMNTELKRKPVWRVNHTGVYEHGVPSANYTLRATYAYPTSRYDGRRKVIISSLQTIYHPTKLGFGIFLLIIGILSVIVAVPLLIRRRATINWCNK